MTAIDGRVRRGTRNREAIVDALLACYEAGDLRPSVPEVAARAEQTKDQLLDAPEMHVWLGCPGSGEFIDFTTSLWPAACLSTIGEEWLAPPPPGATGAW